MTPDPNLMTDAMKHHRALLEGAGEALELLSPEDREKLKAKSLEIGQELGIAKERDPAIERD